MPPKKIGKPLTPEQVAVLRRWVEQGATWTRHWAFKPPVRSPRRPPSRTPPGRSTRSTGSSSDRLEDEGLRPEAEASRTALIRRVTLDLTGLPPTPEEVNAFLADRSARAYETVVDRLLDSPRYGEHMARFWLDAARYGDTHGLHLDNYREIWPYRDWVIRAFNANKPFDRFIVEQLAGDLLPNPSLDQIVATGFNRCHVSTSEGGSIEEEVYVRNIVDQVDTNGTVFMGLSTGCARCHDHKYDPIRAKDYYQLFAFFNNIDGPALDGNSATWAPVVAVPTAAQRESHPVDRRRDRGDREIDRGRDGQGRGRPRGPGRGARRGTTTPPYVGRADFVWVDDALPPGASPQGDGPSQFVGKPDHPVYSGRLSLVNKARGLKQWFFDNAGQKLVVGEGDVLFGHVYLDPKNAPREVMLQWHTAGGWSHRAYWGENAIDFGKDGTPERLAMGKLPELGRWVRLEVPVDRLKMAPGTVIDGWAFTQHGGTVHWDAAGITTRTPQDGQLFDSFAAWVQAQRAAGAAGGLPADLKAAVQLERSKWTEAQARALAAYFVEHADADGRAGDPAVAGPAGGGRGRSGKAIESPGADDAGLPRAGRRAEAGVPAQAGRVRSAGREGGPGGARVPAAVAAGRAGQPPGAGPMAGRARSSADRPGGRQSALAPGLRHRDRQDGRGLRLAGRAAQPSRAARLAGGPVPRGRLGRQADDEAAGDVGGLPAVVAGRAREAGEGPGEPPALRGPRYRLDAEMLRDQALFVGGLLAEHVGGPSVKPPQPSGLWEAVGYTASNTAKFVADRGAGEGPSPQPLHLLEADLGAAADDHLRRPVARGLHGAPRADQHAAPGPAPDERAADDRGLARPGRRVLREAGAGACACADAAPPVPPTATGSRGCSGWPSAGARRPASSPSSNRPWATSAPTIAAGPTTPGS